MKPSSSTDSREPNPTTLLTDLFAGPPPVSPVNHGRSVVSPHAGGLLHEETEESSETTLLVPVKGLGDYDQTTKEQANDVFLKERTNYYNKQTPIALVEPPPCWAGVNLGLSTWIGSFTALLYHTVFCLAHSAALVRPNADHSSMGVLAQMAALGVIAAGASFIFQVGPYVPCKLILLFSSLWLRLL